MFNNIPFELRQLTQWVCSGENKIPLNPRNGQVASVTDPGSWATFDEAIAAGYKHIGFVLTHADPYCIIDLDNKPEKPLSAEEWTVHERILKSFPSYTERSASGRGYHIVIRGKLEQGRRKGNVEVYSAERYMIFTGDVVSNIPIVDCQSMLEVLTKEMIPTAGLSELEQVDGNMTDAEIVNIAMYAANGDKFTALCNATAKSDLDGSAGSYVELGYESQSEADFALMTIIAFYTKDNAQVRRIFRRTGLGKREKAKRDDYLDYALGKIRAYQKATEVTLEQVKQSAEKLIPFAPPEVPKAPEAPPPPQVPAKLIESAPVLPNVELPPGLVGEIAKYFFATAIRPVPEIALAAAIALTAGVCARAFNISGTGLNQYIILLARTGSGKEGALAAMEQLVAAIRPSVPMVDQFMGPAAFSSGQALIRILSEKPCFVSVLGEFGLTLQELSADSATGPQRMLKKVLLDLYAKSGQHNVLRSSVYSDSEKNTSIVSAPNVTIFGESTPETFFDGLTQSQVSEGLIPRFTIVEYKGDRPPRNKNPNQPPSETLKTRFAELVAVSLTVQNKNACVPVQTDPEALVMLDEFDAHCDGMINGSKLDAEIQLWNRAHLKALKLAGLIAVGVNPHQPIVTKELASWAIRFISHDVHVISDRFKAGDVGQGENKQMADLRRVIEQFFTLDEKGRASYKVPKNLFDNKTIPYRYLSQKTASMASFMKDRAGASNALRKQIGSMIDSGMLVEIPKTTLQGALNFQGMAFGIGKEW
jgi:hypothetical protein